MIGSFLTIAIRNLYKHQLYALVNIGGLAVGLAFFTLLLLMIRSELSYDSLHTKSERIYRAIEFLEKDGIGEKSASMPFPFAPALQADYPAYIEEAVRIFNFQVPVHALSVDGKMYSEKHFYFADSNFFHLFDYPIVLGDTATMLHQPNEVIISDRIAQAYFGARHPIGKEIVYEGGQIFKVVGVFAPKDYQSHFEFDFIASFSTLRELFSQRTLSENWMWNPCWTYMLLKDGQSPEDLEYQLADFVDRHFDSPIKKSVSIYLQPLREIHLHSTLDYELGPNGDIQYVYLFGTIAFLLLIVAGINFVNLSTARASTRAREIGIRKALGASQIELQVQFFIEYLLISVIAIFMAMMLVEWILPHLSEIFATDFDFTLVNPWITRGMIAATGMLVGMLSSIYPAYYLASFEPTQALGGTLHKGARGKSLRRSLVVIQFAITIFLMICTLVAFQQHKFLSNYELGFDKSRIIILPIANTKASLFYDQMRQEMLKSPEIQSVTATDELLGQKHQTHQFKLTPTSDWVFFPSLFVKHDFAETFGISIVVGRDFSASIEDETTAVLVNEQFVKHLGLSNPSEAIGKKLYVQVGGREQEKSIIGVIKDFHVESLHHTVDPFVLHIASDRFSKRLATRYMAIKAKNSVQEALPAIERVWQRHMPERTFEAFSLEETLRDQYEQEHKLGLISADFAMVAMFLACLGLFGLGSFMMEQRKREIAIRKALGISDGEVVILLSKEFMGLVGLAILIAWPISYFIMEGWLSSFPFSTGIDVFHFFFSGVLAMGITLFTISYHTVRAAMRNPAEAL